MMRLPIALFSTLLLASCATAPVPSAPAECNIIRSGEWRAWINAMPGPNAAPTLIVTGKVTVPTGGYRFAWDDMRVMESYPVQVAAELRPIAPTGPATEALATHEVRGEWPVSPPVGSVTIRCGGRVLAAISPVETAH